MILVILVQNKSNPYITVYTDILTKEIFDNFGDICNSKIAIGLKETFKNEYGEFLSLDLKKDISISELESYINVLEDVLNKKYNIPIGSFLFKFKKDG